MKKILALVIFTTIFFAMGYSQWLSNGTHIYNSNSGYVGIGTSSPTAVLDVYGRIILTHPSAPQHIILFRPGGNQKAGIGMSGAIKGTSAMDLGLFAETGKGIRFMVNGSANDVMVIDSLSNVGIGTTFPKEKLHVVGSIIASGGYYSQDPDHLDIYAGNPATGNGYAYKVLHGGDGYVSIGTPSEWAGGLLLKTQGLTRMLITADGNIGVGSDNPIEKLQVDGNIKAKKVIVAQSPWPDYVFEPSYSVSSLDRLETFIKKNKHLPDVPTAKEAEEKGISVGDNQAMLLKKIEELTLYVIEQHKQINALIQTVKKIKTKLK